MLAAPKTYPFGTRVRIPGLGVGEVHDRGGAIIPTADYDRIDVWMGKGEEGLARAVNWGARMVAGDIFLDSSFAPLAFDFNHIASELSPGFIARLQEKSRLSNSYVFNQPVEKATPEEIKDLKIALTWLGYYNGPINEILDATTEQSVLAFQLAEGIVKEGEKAGAGNFGPTTRAKLKERIESYDPEKEQEEHRLREYKVLLAAGLGKNATGEDVGALQQMLWELGYYQGPISKQYDQMTIQAVFAFQRDHEILSSENEVGAGYYGQRTHEALIAALDQRIVVIKEYPKEMQTWIPAEISLPTLEELTPAPEAPAPATLRFDIAFTGDAEATHYKFTQDLDVGDVGEAVKKLQEILIAKGYLSTGLNTGSFGSQTQAALRQFQRDQGVSALGRVGPQTREALNTL